MLLLCDFPKQMLVANFIWSVDLVLNAIVDTFVYTLQPACIDDLVDGGKCIFCKSQWTRLIPFAVVDLRLKLHI